MLKRWCDNVYSTSERNYQTFTKMQAKSSYMVVNTNHTTLLKKQSAMKYLP